MEITETNNKIIEKSKNFGCTDPAFLVPLFLFTFLMVRFVFLIYIGGGLPRLIYGYDSFGNICDNENHFLEGHPLSGRNMTGKKSVFYFSFTNRFVSEQICVEKCPNKDLITKSDVINLYQEENINLCEYETTPSMHETFSHLGPCPELPIHPSKAWFNRCIVIPSEKTIVDDSLSTSWSLRPLELLGNDEVVARSVLNAWSGILIGVIFTAGVSYVLIYYVKRHPVFVLFIMIFATLFSSFLVAFECWLKWYLTEDEYTQVRIMPVALIFTLATFALPMFFYRTKDNIRLVFVLYEEGSKFMHMIPKLMYVPLVTSCLFTAFVIFFVLVEIALEKTGKFSKLIYDKMVVIEFYKNDLERYLWWLYLFGCFFMLQVIIACQDFLISCTVCLWYFTELKETLPSPVLTSLNVMWKNHMGTIVFGALLFPLLKLLRTVYELMKRIEKTRAENAPKPKKKKEEEEKEERIDENFVFEFNKKAILLVLTTLVTQANKTVYACTAILSYGFLKGTVKTNELLEKNLVNTANFIICEDSFMLFGKLTVVYASTIIVYVWFRQFHLVYVADLTTPSVISLVCAFCVAHSCFCAFESIANALLFCYCEDLEENKGLLFTSYSFELGLEDQVEISIKRRLDLGRDASEPEMGGGEDKEEEEEGDEEED